MQTRRVLAFVGLPVIIFSSAIALWFFLDPQIPGPKDQVTRKDYAELLLKLIAGAVIFYGAYFTWKRVNVSQEGQITERFTRAIDHLGSDKLQIRLGGIYALERIAQDSPKDHWPIMEVLTAYVRENAPAKPNSEGEKSSTTDGKLKSPPHDIQAILTVLVRRKLTFGKGENQPLDLSNTDLKGADFTGAHLEGAYFISAHLERAFFGKAHLKDTEFFAAYLDGSHFFEANLEGANLTCTHLERADLCATRLKGTNFSIAKLHGADFQVANLEGAFFIGVDLSGAENLTRDQINSALTDEETKLPGYLLKPENKNEPNT